MEKKLLNIELLNGLITEGETLNEILTKTITNKERNSFREWKRITNQNKVLYITFLSQYVVNDKKV